jgi:hypothetical protein
MMRRMRSALLRAIMMGALLPVAAMAAAQDEADAGPQPAALPDPARRPANLSYRLTQSEDRLLPDNSHIRFDWEQQVRFIDAPEGLVIELGASIHRCVGAPRICAAFERLSSAQAGARRFRIGAGGTVISAARDAGVPDATTDSESASGAHGMVAALGQQVDGQVEHAEIQNMLMFAGRILPAPGRPLVDAGRTLTVLNIDAHHALVRAEERSPPDPRDGSAIVSTTDYSVDRTTGLLMSSVTQDMLTAQPGTADAPLLLRRRTSTLTAGATAVAADTSGP